MKKTLKHLLVAITATFIVIGCGNTKKATNNNYGTSMRAAFDFEATIEQIDSVRNADSLPELSKWFTTSYRDFETGCPYIRYTYMVDCKDSTIKYTLLMDKEMPYPFKKIITK